MTVSEVVSNTSPGGTSSEASIARIDRIEVTSDDEHLVANAGLLLVSTLAARLSRQLEGLDLDRRRLVLDQLDELPPAIGVLSPKGLGAGDGKAA